MRLALELGLRDYVEKNGFREVVVGVSGGIDSAVTAALAVEALGAERIHCVSMPSRYSSEETRRDARLLAGSLGADFRELPIDQIVQAFEGVLAESFAGREPDLAEENLQARVRGVLLMALSNKFGWLVVATGNKSELSVGYATLYGDMAGGFALLKDVFKTDVFRLARHLNERAGRELIPAAIIERAPSAELRDNQLDEDSLPPYPALDLVLEAYVEQDRSREELSADGFDRDVVERALALIDRAEYKRRQAPPGVRLTPKAFGRDRRTPITNRGAAELAEPAQALVPRHRGVRRRGGRQDEEPRFAELPLLQPEGRTLAERPAVGLLADEGDHARFEFQREPLETFGRALEIGAAEVAGPFRRPVGRVGETDSEVQHFELLVRPHEPRREPCFVKQPPEVVARVGEMRGRRGRDEARIDPAEDDAQPRPEDVRYFASSGGVAARAARRAAHDRAASAVGAEPTSATCRECRSGSNGCTSSRGEPRLARVQPNLEEPAQFLTRDPGEGQRASRLDLDEPHRPLAGAVATEVALLLAQRSQASHARSLCTAPDVPRRVLECARAVFDRSVSDGRPAVPVRPESGIASDAFTRTARPRARSGGPPCAPESRRPGCPTMIAANDEVDELQPRDGEDDALAGERLGDERREENPDDYPQRSTHQGRDDALVADHHPHLPPGHAHGAQHPELSRSLVRSSARAC